MTDKDNCATHDRHQRLSRLTSARKRDRLQLPPPDHWSKIQPGKLQDKSNSTSTSASNDLTAICQKSSERREVRSHYPKQPTLLDHPSKSAETPMSKQQITAPKNPTDTSSHETKLIQSSRHAQPTQTQLAERPRSPPQPHADRDLGAEPDVGPGAQPGFSRWSDDEDHSRGRVARGAACASLGGRARRKRDSRWGKIPKCDKRRWEANWSSVRGTESEFNSIFAGSQWAEERKANAAARHQLADWDGNWLPAPIDWGSRSAFNTEITAVEKWVDDVEKAMRDEKVSISLDCVEAASGHLAPHYWIPATTGFASLRSLWNEMVEPGNLKPNDDDDWTGLQPWWTSYERPGTKFPFVKFDYPDTKEVDPQEEGESSRVQREKDFGSQQHTQNRRHLELAKNGAHRKTRELRRRAQVKARKLSDEAKNDGDKQDLETQRFTRQGKKPVEKEASLKLCIRFPNISDAKGIQVIYNSYVRNDSSAALSRDDVFVAHRQSLGETEVTKWYTRIIANKLPFFVAYERSTESLPKDNGEHGAVPHRIVGFAFADDYGETGSILQNTVKVEMYTSHDSCKRGVASCLVDKILHYLDPKHTAINSHHAAIEGLQDDCQLPTRKIQNVIFNVISKDQQHLNWMNIWLVDRVGCKQVGCLPGVGIRNKERVNLTIFQRTLNGASEHGDSATNNKDIAPW